MDAKTREALRKSIEKWEAIARGEREDGGAEDCALCGLFEVDFEIPSLCSGCPVAERTGKGGCAGTPYEEWAAHHYEKHRRTAYTLPRKPLCEECRRIAQREVDFLRSLLPEEEAEQ